MTDYGLEDYATEFIYGSLVARFVVRRYGAKDGKDAA